MTIEMFNGCNGRGINAAIMASALLQGCTLRVKEPFVKFDVPDWHFFCSLVYHTYCEFSKDSRGMCIAERLPVSIYMVDGRVFHSKVWCDVENRCMRYVSLY